MITYHQLCDPLMHDRSLPDEESQQAVAFDGLMGCNDCGEPLFYCMNDDRYWHADPKAVCWLTDQWPEAGGEEENAPA